MYENVRSLSANEAQSGWFVGGGEMGERIRDFDWSKSPLGPAEAWSPALRMMVRLLLANRFPLLLWWGPSYISLYNDAYRSVLGTKHPWTLGQPVSECWQEIWSVLQPLIDTPFRGGPATWNNDLCLEINRYGHLEESHFTVAYSPVPDESIPSGIGGVLATVHEITEKVIGDRRMVALRDLSAQTAEAKTAEEACRTATQILTAHTRDVPFAFVYLLDAEGKEARLAGTGGRIADSGLGPPRIDLTRHEAAPWPLHEVVSTKRLQIVGALGERVGTAVPAGPWSDPPTEAVLVPLRANAHALVGVLVAGVSARLKLDTGYRSFFELVAGQIAAAVANARAYELEKQHVAKQLECARLRTESEEALRKSEERFRSLAYATSQIVWTLGPEGRVTRDNPNPSWEAFTGQASEAILGLGWLDAIHPEDRVRIGEIWQRAVDTKTPYGAEYRLKRHDGEYRWVSAQGVAVCNPDGRVEEWIGTSSDITERKQAQEAMRESELQFRTFFENAAVGAAQINAQGRFSRVNARFCQITGYSPEELVYQKGPLDLDPSDEVEADRQRVMDVLQGKAQHLVCEKRLVHKAGHVQWVRITAAAVRDGHGAVLMTAVIVEDITERKEAETELRQREALHQGTLQALSAHIAVLDRVGRILATNQAWEAFAIENGAEGQPLVTVGANYLEVCRTAAAEEDTAAQTFVGLEAVMSGRQSEFTLEYPCHSPGAQRWFHLTIVPLAGSEGGAVVSHVDITARKLAEIARRESEERLTAFLDNSAIIAWMKDDEGRYCFLSRNAERRLEVRLEDWQGKTDFDLWPKLLAEQFRRNDLAVLADGHAVEVVEEALNPDGSHCWWLNSKFLFTDAKGQRYVGGLGVDITERKLTQEKLAHSYAQVRALVHQLESAREQERQSLARELHDEFGQILAALRMDSTWIAHKTEDAMPVIATRAKAMAAVIERAQQATKRIARGLRPQMLDQVGLIPALRMMVKEFAEHHGVPSRFLVSDDGVAIGDPVATPLYRMVQEALTNVAKHAQATEVQVEVVTGDDSVTVIVADNGKGFDETARDTPSAFGLLGMQERAATLGGEVTVTGTPQGVVVEIQLPLQSDSMRSGSG